MSELTQKELAALLKTYVRIEEWHMKACLTGKEFDELQRLRRKDWNTMTQEERKRFRELRNRLHGKESKSS